MGKQCLFPEKEKAVKMIEKIKEKVDNCDAVAVTMLDNTTDFLEDINNSGGKICYEEYRKLRNQITSLAAKFSNNCSCIKEGSK